MKVKLKLLTGFGIIILLTAVVGAVAALGLSSLNSANSDMHKYNVASIEALGLIRENYALQRATYRNFALYDSDSEFFKSSVTKMETLEIKMEDYIARYFSVITDPDERNSFNNFQATYDGEFTDMKKQILNYGRQNQNDAVMAILSDTNIIKMSDSIDNYINQCYEFNTVNAAKTVSNNAAKANMYILILSSVFVAACLVSVLLAFYISGLICKPLVQMTKYFKNVAATGNLTLTKEDETLIAKSATIKDEIGISVNSIAAFVLRVQEIGSALESVAECDLTRELPLLSDNDSIGSSLQKMNNKLNDMLSEIESATLQVSSGIKQISEGAQVLAQGSSEQAAAVEQLSSTITNIAVKTKDNASLAAGASGLAEAIKNNAEKGNLQMEQMLAAANDIHAASGSIGKVIKVIDDLAFQTNILSLNAAVEAARAGQHGKGFAVVAEEVRSLAAKSAKAAKDTEKLIADSIEKAGLGARIAGETAASLIEIVTGINESGKIVANIARSSEEQSLALDQLNLGIKQVAEVVQQNSSTAEESASASEEMSGQARTLHGLVERFKIKDSVKTNIKPEKKWISMFENPGFTDTRNKYKY